MIFAVHLFNYSALKTGREGRGREVLTIPVSQSSWQDLKKKGKKRRKKKLNTQNQKGKKKQKKTIKKKQKQAAIITTLLLFSFVSHLSFVSSLIRCKSRIRGFFWFINERKVSCRFVYLVHPAVIERLFWVKNVKSTLVTADGLRVRPAPVKSYRFETKQVSPAAFRAWMST